MTPTDHYALSIRCRRKAESELEQGDLLTAAELMWGAVVHGVKHLAPPPLRSGMNSHRDVKLAVRELNEHKPGVNLPRYFGAGEVLHRYFYRLHLPDHQVINNFRQCQRFLDLLLPGLAV